MEEPNNYPLNEARETKSAHYNIMVSSRPENVVPALEIKWVLT
jgi:hypothetical protein